MSVLTDLEAKIGTELGVSDWLEVSQDRISTFADVTEDHQFIHIDEEKTKALTPFGGTIAHGFLSLSLLSKFGEVLPVVPGTKMGMNYGFDKVRFLSPVPRGSNVRGHFTLAAVVEKNPGQILLTYAVTVEIEGGAKPALIAEWLTLVFV